MRLILRSDSGHEELVAEAVEHWDWCHDTARTTIAWRIAQAVLDCAVHDVKVGAASDHSLQLVEEYESARHKGEVLFTHEQVGDLQRLSPDRRPRPGEAPS